MLCVTGVYLRNMTNIIFVILHLNVSRLSVCGPRLLLFFFFFNFSSSRHDYRENHTHFWRRAADDTEGEWGVHGQDGDGSTAREPGRRKSSVARHLTISLDETDESSSSVCVESDFAKQKSACCCCLFCTIFSRLERPCESVAGCVTEYYIARFIEKLV